jgi:hypothetical protein
MDLFLSIWAKVLGGFVGLGWFRMKKEVGAR